MRKSMSSYWIHRNAYPHGLDAAFIIILKSELKQVSTIIPCPFIAGYNRFGGNIVTSHCGLDYSASGAYLTKLNDDENLQRKTQKRCGL
jgi:hypothetical protein